MYLHVQPHRVPIFKVAIGEFPKVFKKIEFAVYCSPADQKNYETFSRVLG